MLFDTDLPITDWGDVIMTGCYLQNRLSDKVTKTQSEQWNKKKPEPKNIRIFWSKAFVHVPKERLTKSEAHPKEGILISYSETQKGCSQATKDQQGNN